MRVQLTDGCRRIKVGSESHGHEATYTAGRDGTVEVTDAHARLMIRDGSAYRANLGGRPSGGYRCPGCGRLNFIRTCGGCGNPEGVRA